MKVSMAFGILAALLVSCAAAGETAYRLVPGWPQLPDGVILGQVTGVDVDADGRVFVFHRAGRTWSGPIPRSMIQSETVFVFDGPSGSLLERWGANQFVMPHGLTVDAQGYAWLTDVGLHQVFKFTASGHRILTVGIAGKPGRDRRRFNRPTDVAVLEDGSFYVSDGYRNTRIIKFSAAGQFDYQWGAPGGGPGEFDLPHGLAIDDQGRVYVADRGNARVQVFDANGRYVTQWSGEEIGRPYAVAVRNSMLIALADGGEQKPDSARPSAMLLIDANGAVIRRYGDDGAFKLAHDVAVGPDGAVYVADAHGERVQKFVPETAWHSATE